MTETELARKTRHQPQESVGTAPAAQHPPNQDQEARPATDLKPLFATVLPLAFSQFPNLQFERILKIETAVVATKLPSRSLKVSRERVDPNAFDVLTKLKHAGFQAFLVGGCVRDLLLTPHPRTLT